MAQKRTLEATKRMLRRVLYAAFPETFEALNGYRQARIGARQEAQAWRLRIEDVLACPDNSRLPRHRHAGRVRGGLQTMFNGLQVVADGYYGTVVTKMLRLNKGSHEPQEELVFAEVLLQVPAGGTMVELGAYWGFYSLWFTNSISGGRTWLVEPELRHLQVGRQNFEVNGLRAEFHVAEVGAASAPGEPERISLDDFLSARGIEHLNILHADIQGAEVEMLRGAGKSLRSKAVDFVFISTHGEEIHRDCVDLLEEFDYEVPVSVRPAQSYSFDGLVVAHAKGVLRRTLPVPSLKPSLDD